MYGWISCPFCHHNHLPVEDGLCPRCQQSLVAPSTPAVAEEPVVLVELREEAPLAPVEPATSAIHTVANSWSRVTRWIARGVSLSAGVLGFRALALDAPHNRFFTRIFLTDSEGQSYFARAWSNQSQVMLTGAYALLGLAWMTCAYYSASMLAGREPVFSLGRLLKSWIPGRRPSSETVLRVTRKLASIPSGRESDSGSLISVWSWVTAIWMGETLLVLLFGGTDRVGGWLSSPAWLKADVLLSMAQHLLTGLVVYDISKELTLSEHLHTYRSPRGGIAPSMSTPPTTREWKQAPESESPPSVIDGECPACHHPTDARRCPECGVALQCGAYRIIRLFGQRPHSRTYLALDEKGSRVVLKELSFSLAPNAAVIDAFEREAALLRALNHPQIPKFVDSFAEGQGISLRFYLAQEFVQGRSLQQELTLGRFSEAETKEVLLGVLPVIRFLHEQSPQVIHRDIKPSNIMRRNDGALMLIDFGAARAVGHTLMDATLVGTFGYMPPQQLAGQVDASADLYALGATAVHLVTGRPPWELIRDDLQFVFPREIPLSSAFTKYLHRLVAPQRKQRYPNAAAALAALSTLDAPARWRWRRRS